jgi:TM2 domain-containing membrane protein YozV
MKFLYVLRTGLVLITIFSFYLTCAQAQVDNRQVSDTLQHSATENTIDTGYLLLRDSIASEDIDTTRFFTNLWGGEHSVGKAALFSAIIPGLGQIYNEKYWKVPVVYAGLGIATGFVIYNKYGDLGFLDLEEAVKLRFDGDTLTIDRYAGLASDDQLLALHSETKRYLDLSYISLSFVYLLNSIDAGVDAHLFAFDVSDDITLQLDPLLLQHENYYRSFERNTFAASFGCKINLHIK